MQKEVEEMAKQMNEAIQVREEEAKENAQNIKQLKKKLNELR